jgi:3-hydroxyisobutyrate dehydrogenase
MLRATQVTCRRAFSSSSSSSRASKVGFIGLGNMGGHMAANLLAAGKEVCVFDIAAPAVASAKRQGATAAETPAEVARQCGT